MGYGLIHIDTDNSGEIFNLHLIERISFIDENKSQVNLHFVSGDVKRLNTIQTSLFMEAIKKMVAFLD